MASGDPEGVLITGVYGSGKSSVAAEIGYELEQRGELYALLAMSLPTSCPIAARSTGSGTP